jgi:hypothetical protein
MGLRSRVCIKKFISTVVLDLVFSRHLTRRVLKQVTLGFGRRNLIKR